MPQAPDLTRQAARYGGLVEAARRYLALLWPRVDWGHPKAQDAVTTMYQSIVQRFGTGAAAVAADLYDQMRAEQKPRNAYRAFAADPVPNEQVAKIVASAFHGNDNSDVPVSQQTTSDLPVEQRVQKRLEDSLSRLVQQPARDTIAANADKDRSKPRWIRVPTGPTTCEFCIMLASRELGKNFGGYRSEHNALFDEHGETYHRNCDCVAVPVWGDPRDLSPHMSDYKDIYDEAADRAGTTRDAKKILAEMRQVIKEKGQPPAPEPPGLPEPVELDTPKPAVHQGDTHAPVEPKAPEEPLPGVRRRTTEFDPLGPDLALINPNYAGGRQWQVNCTRCATAVELQARGYDVTAEPRPASVRDNGYANVLGKWASPDGTPAGQGGGLHATRGTLPDGEVLGMSAGSRVWDYLPARGRGKVNAAKAAADAAVTEWGDGARGYITVEWSKANGGGAHIFNVVNRGGRVVYIDGQSNETDASGHWDRIKATGGSCRIVRTDDLETTSDAIDWVRSRNDNDDLLAQRKAARLASLASSAGPGELAGSGGTGSVDRSQVPHLRQHELDTAERLALRGHHVVFVPATGVGPTADATIDGQTWEIKSISGSSDDAVARNLRRAKRQSTSVVLDVTDSSLTDDQVKALVEHYGRRYNLDQVHVIRGDADFDWRWHSNGE